MIFKCCAHFLKKVFKVLVALELLFTISLFVTNGFLFFYDTLLQKKKLKHFSKTLMSRFGMNFWYELCKNYTKLCFGGYHTQFLENPVHISQKYSSVLIISLNFFTNLQLQNMSEGVLFKDISSRTQIYLPTPNQCYIPLSPKRFRKL